MGFIIGVSRIILPLLTIVIIAKCMLALLLGHPKEKIYGYIIDMKDGSEYPLNMWETSVGRSGLCDIAVGRGSVSRHHAVISRRIDGWYIFDLISKQGVTVNGEKINGQASVQSGDILGFGEALFKFEIADDPVQAAGRKRKTRRGQNAPAPEARPHAAAAGEDDFELNEPQNIVHSTGRIGDPALVNCETGSITVLRGNLVTLGRSSVSDICLPYPTVSRKHANLVLYEDGWAVEDAGSSAGTLLNGSRVTSPQLLFDGDILTLAEIKLKFRVLPRTYH